MHHSLKLLETKHKCKASFSLPLTVVLRFVFLRRVVPTLIDSYQKNLDQLPVGRNVSENLTLF